MRGILKNGIYTKYEDEAQLLQLGGGSWSINLEELPEEAILIEYITQKETYVTNRLTAFRHGFVKNLGGEEKLVVPLQWWQKGAVAINE